MMKSLIEKRRYFITILVAILIILGTYLPGYADITPVSQRTPQVRDAIVAAVPDVNNAADVTEAHLAKIWGLGIASKGITSLKSGDFEGLTALTHLHLEDNSISDISPLENLTALIRLELHRNSISDISALENLTALINLNLESNSISDISTLENLTALINLNLNNNSISDISALEDMTALTYLNLESNSISDISALEDLTALISLNLNNNSISDITALSDISALENLTALRTLFLSDNSISDISALENLTALSVLRLEGNLISDYGPLRRLNIAIVAAGRVLDLDIVIDPLIERTQQVQDAIVRAAGVQTVRGVDNASLAAITALDLSWDVSREKITSLKVNDFSGLTSLEVLRLSHNSLTSLPEGIYDGLSSLETIDLLYNNINSIPANMFKGLTSLKSLDLQGNRLTSLSTEWFDDLSSLETLSFDSNSLTEIPANVFDQLNSLKSLDLSSNSLTSLPTDVFEELSTLTHLDLRNTSLTSLPADVFDGLSVLSVLDLGYNKLQNLPIGIFEGLSSLTQLELSGNTVTPMPIDISLKKVADGQFKAVAPTGAPFDIVLPLSVTHGSISGGATSITIATGELESNILTAKRTASTTDAVTVNIGTLPGIPSGHSGYALVKSTTELPLTIMDSGTTTTNNTPVFTDGARTNRAIAENTAGTNIGPAVSAKDADNDSLTYTLSGTDAAMFSIVSVSGQLQTKPALDYKAKTVYSVTVSVSDDKGGIGSITVTISSLLIDRTPQVRDAIVSEAGVNSAADVTAAHLSTITSLDLRGKSINSLKVGDFSGLTSLKWLYLTDNSISDISPLANLNSLTSLTLGHNSISDISPLANLNDLVFLDLENNSISNIITLSHLTSLRGLDLSDNYSISNIAFLLNLTSLTRLDLQNNSINSVRVLEGLTSLEDLFIKNNLISDYGPLRRLKAANPDVNIDIDLNNNPPVFSEGLSTTRSIAEGSSTWRNIGAPVSATDADNDTLAYSIRGTDAASFQVGLRSGQLQNRIPLDYETKNSYSVTIYVRDGNGGGNIIYVNINVTDVDESPIIPISDRTPEVQVAIISAIPNVSNAANVTATHLAAITNLNLRNAGITALNTEDFSGMTGLTTLNLFNNQLSSLPDGIFEGLTSLTTIRLGRNAVDPLPLTISLEKVGINQFKAVTPAGATFDIVLPITVTNGSISGGATTITIPHGSVESGILTVTRTPGTTAAVTADIGTLPILPRNHYGYALVKSDGLPLTIFSSTNSAPVFTDGANTTRSVAENTVSGEHIGTAITATDAENDTLTYTLSGTDASTFVIDTASGQLKTKDALDYETKQNYTVSITVSDGSLTSTITVTINITDIDEVVTPPITPDPPTANSAPYFYEGDNTTRFIAENTPAGTKIGNAVLATDANNDFLAYTLGGTDADAFDMDSSGQLKTKAPLDYETKRIYSITITVDDEELSNTISVIINVIDVNDTVLSAGFVPVSDRTPAVRDAIVAAVPNVTGAAKVTESQVAAITDLNLRGKGISSLKTGDFSGMTALTSLNLFRNNLSSLPPGIFDGLTALITLRLGGNVVDPIPLIVSLQQVGDGQFKAVVTTGAPFNIVLPINVTNGSLSGGGTSVTIPKGSMESSTFTVSGTSPKVAFGTLPGLPRNHFGYVLAQSNVCNRTEQIAETIAKAVGVNDCSGVTEVDLATITNLDLSGQSIASLSAGDFDGMLSLRTLSLSNNDIESLPSGIFDDLVSLRELFLSSNKLTTVPGGIFSNLSSLTNLYLQSNSLSALPSDAFDGLSDLRSINLQDNDLTSLPGGVFDGTPYLTSILLSNNKMTSIPNGIFKGLTQLNQLHLSWNPNPSSRLSLTVSLQKVGTNQLKAVAPSGAPFTIVVPISVKNGTLAGGATALRIPTGEVESLPITVTRTPGTTATVTADIGSLPNRPSLHNGYALAKGTDEPVEVLPRVNLPPAFTEGASTTRSIAENVAAGTNIGDPVTATDQDVKDTLTYAHGGTDAASFSVDSATGQLKTKVVLDYETKTSYTITVVVSDGMATDAIGVTINVINVDENRAPVFTEGASTTRTVAENTVAGTNIANPVDATDADNDTLTYRLSGTDASAFVIDTSTGQLKTSAALDYETKAIYSVSVTVSDGKFTDTIAVIINVTDVAERSGQEVIEVETPTNNVPVFTAGTSATRSIAENTGSGVDIGTPVTATDVDGDTLTYTLGGTDAAAFSIASTSGQLRTSAALDYETKTSYSVTITVSDGNGGTNAIAVTINVTDVDETPSNNEPVFSEGSSTSRSVLENIGSGVDIGSAVSATDADGDTLSYSIGGTDASAFSIDSSTGQLSTSSSLDYETQNSYSVVITASDGSLTSSIDVTIDVIDANEAPVFTAGSSTSRIVVENAAIGANIGTAVSATDEDGDNLTYSLGGTDAAAFGIDNTTGQLQTNVALNTSTKTTYSVTITASDGSLTDSISVTINVRSVNDAPVFTEGNSATRSIAENTAANTNIGTAVSATDADGDTLTYTLGGTDAAAFGINTTNGQLRTSAALNFETKATYSVSVTASDGNLTDNITLTINVTDANDVPVFTGGTSTTRSIAENTGAAINIGTAISATDEDDDTLTYTLSGTDAASFDINSTNGQLQTKAALDFEDKNQYTVTVSVSDGNNGTDTINVTINITDLEETPTNNPPVFTDGTSTTRSIAENTTSDTNIGTPVAATDADNNTLAYTLSGTDAASFGIDSTTGQLKTNASLDHETKDEYSVTVNVNDGSTSVSITVTINVTDVNDVPVFTDGTSATRTIAENTASGTNIGTAIPATDQDGDDLTYTLGGTDSASFSIVSASGQLQTSAALNYENKSSYAVTITVSDGSLTDTIDVTINITDANDAPAFSDGTSATRSVAENTDSDTNIGSAVAATDPDTDDTLTYTLGGTDAESFSIVSTSGQLQTKASLDYETKTSYSVTISVSDGNGGSDSIDVTINVTDVDENRAPSFTDGSSTTRSVAENTGSGNDIGSAVGATDPDNDTLTYTLGGTDAASFSINSTNGQLRTSATLNYESTTSYSVTITVSDSKLTDSISVTINVSDVNEAPIFTDGTSTTRSVAENTASDQNIGSVVAATDVDSGTTLNYTLGGTDVASFSIVSASGQLQTKAALDYETKTSYSVTITVSDGSLTDSITVTINVSNVNEQPTFASGASISNISATEDTAITSVTLPAATDPDANTTITYTLTPALPAGLTFTASTRILAGTPTAEKTSTTYTYKASDGDLSSTLTFTIQVDAAPTNNAPVFTDGTSTKRSVAENTTSGTNIGTAVAATDTDTSDTLTYSLSGTDASSFDIVSTSGQLQTKAALDYETKTSYSVTVSVSDGNGGTDSISVTINVTDVDETIISPALSERTSQVRDEIVEQVPNVTNADDVTAAHLAAITYMSINGNYSLTSLKSGDFNGLTALTRLDLNGNNFSTLPSGIFDKLTSLTRLSLGGNNFSTLPSGIFEKLTSLTTLGLNENNFSTLPSGIFEKNPLKNVFLQNNKLTSLPDNIFKGATFGWGSAVRLQGNSVDPLPITISLKKVAEGQFKATAHTGATFDYVLPLSVTNGSIDSSVTSITIGTGSTESNTLTVTRTAGTTGAVTVNVGTLPVLGSTHHSDNHSGYVLVKSSDLPLKVINQTSDHVNNAPTFTDGTSTTRSVAENTAAGQNIGTAVAATDSDSDTLTYTLGGTDSASFSIVSTSGQLQTSAALDYETKSSYSVTVSVSDGNGGNDSITVTIAITDVSETNSAPTFTDGTSTTRSVAESTGSNQNIGTAVSATDTDTNDTLTYTLSGTDASSFSIGSNSGQLQTKAALDYETKKSYSVTVSVSDGNGGSDSIDVTINVTDVDEAGNDPPTFTDGSSTTRSVAENTTLGQNIGGAVTATDSDSGDTLTYSLGGTDSASFSIVSTSGQLQTSAALDYETKTSYSVTVSVSDGNGGSDSITVTINVTDVENEGETTTYNVGDTIPGFPFQTGTFSFGDTFTAGGTVYTCASEGQCTITNGEVTAGTITVPADSGAPSGQTAPKQTALLTNYPNPFNPETWIPYQLSTPSEVIITIYDIRGRVVRVLVLGHQPAGVYRSRIKAAHWDGRNHFGEKVATGVYFYTLKAGDFSATRKMLIRK